MTETKLTFEELDALVELIEMHDDWCVVGDCIGYNVRTLFNKIVQMRHEAL